MPGRGGGTLKGDYSRAIKGNENIKVDINRTSKSPAVNPQTNNPTTESKFLGNSLWT